MRNDYFVDYMNDDGYKFRIVRFWDGRWFVEFDLIVSRWDGREVPQGVCGPFGSFDEAEDMLLRCRPTAIRQIA